MPFHDRHIDHRATACRNTLAIVRLPEVSNRPAPSTITVTGVCHHDCPDSCVWEVTVETQPDGTSVATQLRGKADHPFTRGELCPKVNRFLDRVYHPDRLLDPLVRAGTKGDADFRQASWDEALALIGARLREVIERDSPSHILPYGYAGNQGLIQCTGMSERLFNKLGAAHVVGGLCGNAANAGIIATQGSGVGIDPEDLRHSKVVLLWGTNTLVTNRHLWPVVQEARARGGTVVCIDPLRTATAARADWHVQLLPGTDGALALGMMNVLIARDLLDHDFIEARTVGFDELKARVSQWTPERAGAICGLPAGDVERLAVLYGTSKPAAIRVLIGMEHRQHGAMAYRNISCLPALTGAWRDVGGGLIRSTEPLFEQLLPADVLERPDLAPGPRRPVLMGSLGDVLTSADPTERVDALVVYNCNPAVIVPSQSKVLDGLRRPELFTVVLEQFLTDTARFADVVLPVTTQIEHLDLMPPWGHLYLTLNRPAIPPRGDALPNTEIFRRIARELGIVDPALEATDEQVIREVLDASTHPFMDGITYDRLVREGSVKVGRPDEWRPYDVDAEPPGASGKIEFLSARLRAEGLDPLPEWRPADEGLHGRADLRDRFPLACITTKRHQRFLNSSYAQLPAHTTAEREPTLEIHPHDAAPRGIEDGDAALVWNDRGAMTLTAQHSDRVRPGVVTVPFGWPLSAAGGVGCNVLTNDRATDLGGGTAFHDNLVEVTRARARPD
jgi:anaerobic selenocysteine-containing dehydrogenase